VMAFQRLFEKWDTFSAQPRRVIQQGEEAATYCKVGPQWNSCDRC